MKGFLNILGGEDALIMSIVKYEPERIQSTYLPANLSACPPNKVWVQSVLRWDHLFYTSKH